MYTELGTQNQHMALQLTRHFGKYIATHTRYIPDVIQIDGASWMLCETPIDLQLALEILIMSIMLDLDYHHWTLIKELWCIEILLA